MVGRMVGVGKTRLDGRYGIQSLDGYRDTGVVGKRKNIGYKVGFSLCHFSLSDKRLAEGEDLTGE